MAPMGPTNTVMFFQYGMESIFDGLTPMSAHGCSPIMVIYVDDIIVFGKDEESFLANLRVVFQRCRDSNLILKASKCELGFEEVRAVGYLLSQQGRRMDPARVEAVKAIPAPRNVKQLRRFLGKVNYFHDFIPMVHESTAMLNALTKKGHDFIWKAEHEAAFQSLKAALTAETLLEHAVDTPGVQYVLRTDASPGWRVEIRR